MRFRGAKTREFPVFFPVSREFGRRMVSARLSAPPDSLDCREFLPLLSTKYANSAHFSRFLLAKPDCRERTAPAADVIRPPFFSEAAMSSPTRNESGSEHSAIESRMHCEPGQSYPIQDEPEGELRFQHKMSLERMAC